MKVFIYESENGLNSFFNSPEFLIPFLSTNLLSFMGTGVVRNSIVLDEDYQIFLPAHWEPHILNSESYEFYTGDVSNQLQNHQKKEYELVFLANLFSLMVADFFDEDISHLKQNPEKLFSNRGVIGGYLKRGQEPPKPESFEGFKNFLVLDDSNFLRLNQDLVANLSIKSVGVSARTYGTPIILSENVVGNSTICGPCYIGENVTVESSYIAPGTILLGDTKVLHSRVYGSFVHDSVIDSSDIHDSMLSGADITTTVLEGYTRLPFGSVVKGER